MFPLKLSKAASSSAGVGSRKNCSAITFTNSLKSTLPLPSLSINLISSFTCLSPTLIPRDSHTFFNSLTQIEPESSLSNTLKQSLSSLSWITEINNKKV
ncbi:hypothetical protein BpHYR1_033373 [Brachionus plicatilis]|uniref:Uncharacterized protein n=1 Tax=Brachionus plicatilis TaxID=10195 RepID=A0A3M7SQY8_BRAPC|nr:hypothetical protein BpHYR1_033373 [Brachionus plicatilis]